jgi:hypothetical protein
MLSAPDLYALRLECGGSNMMLSRKGYYSKKSNDPATRFSDFLSPKRLPIWPYFFGRIDAEELLDPF